MKKAEEVRFEFFRRKCGPTCPVLSVLLPSLLLGALLVARGLCTGGLEDAGEQCALMVTCWFLVVAGIAGALLAGHGISWGWLVLLGVQPLWIAYGIVTGQHGFIACGLAYGVAQLNGFIRSRASSLRMGPKQPVPPPCGRCPEIARES